MDAIRLRFGRAAIGYLPAELSRAGGVPDGFRELAEREL
jgi:DNA polymerase-4